MGFWAPKKITLSKQPETILQGCALFSTLGAMWPQIAWVQMSALPL